MHNSRRAESQSETGGVEPTRGKVEMKNSLILALILGLAAMAAAQQTNTTSSSNVTAGDREPLASPRPNDFWDGDDPNLVNLVTHPFANKKYVQRHVGPIRDRLNELEQINAENGNGIKDVDGRAQQGLQLASEKTSLADQHASDAASKAQLATDAATSASARVGSAEKMVGNLDQYQGAAQTEIRFRPGQTVLSKTSKDALDQMAESLKGQRGYIIEIRGFSPGRGQTAIANSRKMADSVVRYLVLTHNIPVYRIHQLSMGNAGAVTGEKHTSPRVEINLLKNDTLASTQR